MEFLKSIQAPRMTEAEITALDMTGVSSALVFNTDINKHVQWNGLYWAGVDGVIEDVRDSTELTTFSTTGVTYMNIFKTGLDNTKQYELSGFYIWNHDGTTQDFWAEIRNFGVLIFPRRHQQEPKDSGGGGGGGTNQGYYTAFNGVVTPTAGQIAADIFFGTTINNQESTIFYGQMKIKEL